eukprot:2668583-Rhodomonas_salina.1
MHHVPPRQRSEGSEGIKRENLQGVEEGSPHTALEVPGRALQTAFSAVRAGVFAQIRGACGFAQTCVHTDTQIHRGPGHRYAKIRRALGHRYADTQKTWTQKCRCAEIRKQAGERGRMVD